MENLLQNSDATSQLRCDLTQATVAETTDGGMGSLRFLGGRSQRMGRELVSATYIDSDGTPVELSVNLDEDGRIFELDIWKVDFSPLQQFPKPEQLTFA